MRGIEVTVDDTASAAFGLRDETAVEVLGCVVAAPFGPGLAELPFEKNEGNFR